MQEYPIPPSFEDKSVNLSREQIMVSLMEDMKGGVPFEKAVQNLQLLDESASKITGRIRPTHGTFAASGDWHVPDHNPKALAAYFDYLIDTQPAIVFFMGDILDLTQLSSFDRANTVKLANMGTVLDDYAILHEMLVRLRAKLPTAWFEFVEGNHEYRISRALERDPAARDYVLEKHFSDVFDRFVPYRDKNVPNLVQFGKRWLAHGEYCNEMHTKKNLMFFHRPICTWHMHTVQAFTLHSAVDVRDFKVAFSVPCLADLNPHYARSKPNAWVNGFLRGEALEDGAFEDSIVIMDHDRFGVNGKWYGE